VGLLVAYPLFDVVFVVVDRLVGRRPIYVGGTDHTTHRLGRRLGAWGTLGVISVAVATNACLAIWVWGLQDPQLAIAAVLISGLAYATFGALLRRIGPTP
jgi:hypothetical protein